MSITVPDLGSDGSGDADSDIESFRADYSSLPRVMVVGADDANFRASEVRGQ